MRPIVESRAVRAERRSYTVPGWGEGELWIGEGLVLANDFRFSDLGGAALGGGSGRSHRPTVTAMAAPALTAIAATPATTAPKGATKPPSNTVASTSERMGNGSVAESSNRVDHDEVVAGI